MRSGNLSPSRCAAGVRLFVGSPLVFLLLLVPSVASAGESTPPPGASEWLAIFAWLVGIAAGITLLVQRWFPRRSPPIELDVERAIKACREQCDRRHEAERTRIEARQEAAEKHTRELEQLNEERARRIHERLEKIIPVLYRIAGKLEVSID